MKRAGIFTAAALGVLVGRDLADRPRVRRVVHVALGRPIAYGVRVVGTLDAKPGTSVSNVHVETAPPSVDPAVLADRFAAAITDALRPSGAGIHFGGAR